MNKPVRWLYVIAAAAAAVVAVSSVVAAIRQGSWGPVVSVGWLSAVIVATLPSTRRGCLPRRHRQAP